MLKILWYFSAPSSPFGYGVVTREICSRMIKDGHDVKVATRAFFGPPRDDLGIPTFSGVNSGLVQYISDAEKTDYIFMTKDPTQSPVSFSNWVACAAFDFEFLYPDLIANYARSKAQFCVSQHNLSEMQRVGFNPYFAPWGVDTAFYHKDDEARKKFREKLGISEDTFLIGAIGSNLKDDRKNYINLIKAFQQFNVSHENIALFLNTDVIGAGCIPLQKIITGTGLDRKIFWVDQYKFHKYAVTQEEVRDFYNGIDVLCQPFKGESFCLPLLEAQSCETPAIAAGNTAGPENTYRGWIIPIDDDDYEWLEFGSWNAVVRPTKICNALEKAFEAWDAGKMGDLGLSARNAVFNSDWDIVYNKYWKPFLKILEDNR